MIAAAMLVGVAAVAASPASAAEENATFFEFVDEGWGYKNVDPGNGVNLTHRSTCRWWGCPDFDNKVSSPNTRGGR